MDSNHLHAVITIADLGSMRRAASVLHCSQSSLSQMLKNIERELGLPLFERLPSGLRLRPAAAPVIEQMRHTLAQIEQLRVQAASAAREQDQRLVVMSASPSNQYILPDAIARWRALHPDIALEFHPGHQNEQMPALLEGRCDVGLLGMPEAHPGITFHPIATVHMLLAVPASSHWRSASLEQLAAGKLPMAMVPESSCPGIARCTRQALAAAKAQPQLRNTVTDMATLIGTIGSGGAWGLIPQGFTDLFPERVLFRQLPEDLQPSASFDFCLAQRSDDQRPLINDWLTILRSAAARIYQPLLQQ
ncbi:MAG: LysR family transcriptional regulator [Planctomycetota bacterium]|nr:MAG: LysR family transcriptional regulator [Planctomycetota bacterium]